MAPNGTWLSERNLPQLFLENTSSNTLFFYKNNFIRTPASNLAKIWEQRWPFLAQCSNITALFYFIRNELKQLIDIFLAVPKKLNFLILVGVICPTLFLEIECEYLLSKDFTTKINVTVPVVVYSVKNQQKIMPPEPVNNRFSKKNILWSSVLNITIGFISITQMLYQFTAGLV